MSPNNLNRLLPQHAETVIRASAYLYLAASLIAAASFLVPDIKDSIRVVPALVLVGMGLPAAVFTFRYPWQTKNHNWTVVIGLMANVHLGVFLWATGGADSPYWPFIFFVIIGGVTYYFWDLWALSLLILASIVGTVSPLFYDRPETFETAVYVEFVVRTVIVLIVFVMGRWLFTTVQNTSSMAVRLEETRGDFLLAVAHQLKTPMSSLRAALETVNSDPIGFQDGSPARRALEVALRSERRMEVQLERILDYFRLESGQAELTMTAMSLERPVGAAVKRIRTHLEAKNQILAVTVPGDLTPVYIDAGRIETVLVDLLENAVEFSPVNGQIALSAFTLKGKVVVKVSDSGPGVPAEERSRIFEPYYRSESAPSSDRRRTGSGTGLGLAIARSIVHLHGGQIWQESDAGHGNFCFTLPCAKSPTPVKPAKPP